MLARSNTAEDILITTYDKNHNPIGAARIRTPSPNPQNIPAVESIEQSIYQIDSIAPLSKQPSYQEIRKHSISQNYSRPIFTHSPLPLSSPDLSPRLHRLNNPGRESENWNEGFGNGEIVSAFDHDEKGKKKDDGHEGGCCSCVIC